MTTAAAATLDQFEARTYDALAGVTRVRRALRDHGRILLSETVAYWVLHRFMATLSNEWLAALAPDKAEEAARWLGELHTRLSQVIELAESRGITTNRLHRRYFRGFGAVNDRVGDVLESLHLALNEDFRTLIGACADELKDRPGRRRDWRSSLAALRD
jgi:hypothetical protein